MRLGVLLIALAGLAWGTTGSVTTVLVHRAGAEPLLIGAVRLWLAALLLVPAARLGGGLPPRGSALGAGLGMGAAMAAFQASYFTAVTMTGIAVAALVAICSAPLMIAALAILFLGERLTARLGLALALGVGGTALLVAGPDPGGASPRSAGGLALALGAGLAYAVYAVTAKAFVQRTSALGLTAFSFAAAAVVSTPLALSVTDPLGQVARGWPWLLYLGGVATAGAYALYALGLRGVPASVAGVVTLIEPLTATALGVLVFGERLGAAGLVGAVLLVGAIGLLVAGEFRGRSRHVSLPGSAGTPPG